MREILAKNVILNVKKLNKFRTIKIQIDFLRPIRRDESTKRRLLANVLSHSTKKYPSFKALNDREMELYGSEINAYTRSLLNFNDLGFSVEFADPNFLIGDNAQIKDNLDLLAQLIFDPNIREDGLFEKTAFNVEKRNMLSNLDAVVDNQDLVSALELSKLIHTNNPDRQLPIFGDQTQLEKVTNQNLVNYYRDAVANDFVLINVVGDVDQDEFSTMLKEQLHDYLLTQNRNDLKIQFDDFSKLIEQPALKTDKKQINQSRLAMAYATEKNDDISSHLAPQAANLILGGDDQSQLFLQVREKNSLAYSVSSTFQPSNRLLTIQAGLDASAIEQAIELINQQIEFIKDDKFSDDQLTHAKKVLFTRREISSDNIQHYIMRSIWECVYPEAILTEKEYRSELDKLTRKQIIEVIDRMHFIAQYKLIGE